MSNVLGTLTPVERLADAAHAAGALVLVDAAPVRAPPRHRRRRRWDADFVGFTGHKMLGPTGIGVLWGREELLEAMPAVPRRRRDDPRRPPRRLHAQRLPWKFEAGTPPIAEAIGLGAAVDYLDGARHGRRPRARGGAHRLRPAHAHRALRRRPHASTARPSRPSGAACSRFAFSDVHPHDLSQVLDEHGVCVRAGHHCAKPLMRVLGVGATARASLYVYNDEADVDALADALDAAAEFFAF